MGYSDNLPGDNLSHQAFGGVLHSKLLGHQVVGVQGVNGELDENWTGCSGLSNGQGLPERGHDLSNRPDGGTELTERLEERHLVDVLQRSSTLRHKWFVSSNTQPHASVPHNLYTTHL